MSTIFEHFNILGLTVGGDQASNRTSFYKRGGIELDMVLGQSIGDHKSVNVNLDLTLDSWSHQYLFDGR